MIVAILGGGSCFGFNLSKHLVERGDSVISISRSQMPHPALSLGLEDSQLFEHSVAHLVRDLPFIMDIFDELMPEIIVNFAALCELRTSFMFPEHYFETNTMAHVRLVKELQSRSYLKKFIQMGTSELYGSVIGPATEESRITCSSPYAASKAAFDLHLEAVSKNDNFPGLILRPSNGYCEGQRPYRIIPKTIISAIKGTRLQLEGGGMAKKSYLHGDDISAAVMLLMEKGEIGEVYNAGAGDSITIRTLVETVAGLLGRMRDDVAEDVPDRPGQDAQYWLDSTKIGALGWAPTVPITDGLRRMVEWVKANPALLSMDSQYRHSE